MEKGVFGFWGPGGLGVLGLYNFHDQVVEKSKNAILRSKYDNVAMIGGGR